MGGRNIDTTLFLKFPSDAYLQIIFRAFKPNIPGIMLAAHSAFGFAKICRDLSRFIIGSFGEFGEGIRMMIVL